MRSLLRVLLVATALGLVLMPASAQAHAVLASSQPEPGERLGTAPGVVVLEFTEPLNAKLSRATVTDPTGRRFTGRVTGGEEIRVPLGTNASGIYTVDWASVSTLDGHTVRGSYRFGVGVSPSAATVETAQTSPGAADLVIAALRWIEYLALLVTMGMLLLRRLARGRPELDWVRLRPLFPVAVALASGVTVVAAEAFSAAGSASLSAVWSYLTTGLPGIARLARLNFEAIALLLATIQAPTLWLSVVAAIAALAASGHAAAIHPAWWGVTVDGVHLLAAGVWAGGILALATLRPPGGWRSAAGRELLVRFSSPALAAFGFSIAFGAIQAIQELGSVHALVGSTYGWVLLIKVLLVGLMVPLSLVAWRLRRPHLRWEATLGVFVIAASAILAAFPVPPSRLTEEEASARTAVSTSALPTGEGLTMGSHAGQVLVGLTIQPARPGPNELLVYLLPLEGNEAAGDLKATVSIGDRAASLADCGNTCRRTTTKLQGGETVSVSVGGSKGGVAAFDVPKLPAPGGSGMLEEMTARMHELETYRLDDVLSSGLAVVHASYAFEAPNRIASTVKESGGGSRTVLIGGTRYLKELPDGRWQVERGGPTTPVPSFTWDYFRPFIDPRIVGTDRVDHVPTTIVSFFGSQQGTPIWFRLWIDHEGLVRKTEMRAQGHFMNDRYFDFDAPIEIRPPTR